MWVVLVALAVCGAVSRSVPSVPLPLGNNIEMPVVGLGVGSYGQLLPNGTWGYGEYWNDTVCAASVALFLKQGGRRIDTSLAWYHDLAGVRMGLQQSGVARGEVFITAKVDGPFGAAAALEQISKTLSILNASYVDLVLMHWPAPMAWDFRTASLDTTAVYTQPCGTPQQCRVDTMRGLHAAVAKGLARAAGVANYEWRHLQDLVQAGVALPAVNQIEFHPYWHQDDLVVKMQGLGIVVNSYSPLGAPDYMAALPDKWPSLPLDEPAVLAVAAAVKRTAAQVALKWQLQKGLVANPRTLQRKHMVENLSLFDFVLSSDQVASIDAIRPPLRNKVCPDPFLLA